MAVVKLTVAGGVVRFLRGWSVIQVDGDQSTTPAATAAAGTVLYDDNNGQVWIDVTSGTWVAGAGYWVYCAAQPAWCGPINVVAAVGAAWLTGWTYRRAIFLDQPEATLTNFPVLVALTATVGITDTEVLDTGYDLRFTSDDGDTTLGFERENYSEAGGKALGNFWVKVPSINLTTAALIFVYWGKADAADGSVATAPWDASTVSVYHMNEAAGAIVDSKSALNGAGQGDLPDNARAGRVHLGQDCDGNGDWISVNDNAAHDPGAAMTIESWVLLDAGVAFCALVTHDTSNYKWLLYGPLADKTVMFYVRTATGVANTPGTYKVPDTTNFHHIVGVYDKTLAAGRVALYADGNLEDAVDGYNEDISAGDEGITIGTWTKSASECVNGVIDEVRYHNAARSAEWIHYTYHNMADADNAQTWAAKETASAPPEGNRRRRLLLAGRRAA